MANRGHHDPHQRSLPDVAAGHDAVDAEVVAAAAAVAEGADELLPKCRPGLGRQAGGAT
jgi:hypothetical protein